jgi:hypothetical protein
MTSRLPTARPATPGATIEDYDHVAQDRIDRWLVAGCILAGTWIFGIPGVVVFIVAHVMMRKARKRGIQLRDDMVTLIGIAMLVDGCANFFAWSLDLTWVNHTAVVQTLFPGFGRIWDGGYYLGYNSTGIGGTAFAGEKGIEFATVCMLYPMRIVASWGFLKMKRWGFQAMVINMWASVFFWMDYLMNFSMGFNDRMPFAEFGTLGWWIVDIWYSDFLLVIPYLYTVNKNRWTSPQVGPGAHRLVPGPTVESEDRFA